MVNLYVHVREDVADVVVEVLLLFFPGLFDILEDCVSVDTLVPVFS